MSLKRWAARRDSNEQSIVQALRKAGAIVAFVSDKGICDLLVLFRGNVFMLETKTRLGRATMAQKSKTEEGWPVVVVRTEIEALRAVGAVS